MSGTVSLPVGVYFHVPFCRRKCPYCDFYSVGVTESLLDAFTDETVRRVRELRGESVVANTVYFGGGTPAMLGATRLARILGALEEAVCLAHDAEITVEANPSADLSVFLREAAAAGVNRLSLGMQSAVESELKALGRSHSPDDVKRSMEAAHAAGIHNLSLDLMLGIPHQTSDTLAQSLAFLREAAPAHISAYLLKIEEGTAFYRHKDSLPVADEDGQADLYLQTFDSLDRMGYTQYEISNAAKDGLRGRHNLKYWNDEEYIGIGPAAHGFFRGERYAFGRSLKAYLTGGQPTSEGRGGDEAEYIMLRLRLREGLTERGMCERFGHGIPAVLREKACRTPFRRFFDCDDAHMALTREGMLLSNPLIGEMLHCLEASNED